MVYLLERLLQELAAESRHQGRASPAARPRAGGACVLLPRHDRHRICLPVHRLGRAVGHRRQNGLRSQAPSGGVRQGSYVLRPGSERALCAVRHRAVARLRPRGARVPLRRLRRRGRGRGEKRRAYRSSLAPGARAVQVRGAAALEEARPRRDRALSRAAEGIHGGLRRRRFHRQALPP